ncbi:MAG: InlB B-repeat-containing protein, partial [Bacteroidaceae bacterium]|nr:InlB B-repeat-containing protein [Bacteroidaceae bacterium]
NNIIHIIRHTARAATVLLLALLTAQTAWATALTDFVTVSSQGTATARFAYSDHFYRVDWSGINTSQTTSVLLNYSTTWGRLVAERNGYTKSDITLYASASLDSWESSHVTGLTPGQSSDGYTTYADLATGASDTSNPPVYKKVCTVTCLSATPTWAWSADRSACTATFTCAEDASLTATVTATVTAAGGSITASATFNGTAYTDTKTDPWGRSDGRDGSEANPYAIGSPEALALLSTYVNAGNNASGLHFEQTQDIDMSSAGRAAEGRSQGENFTPIGSKANDFNPTPFNGTYGGTGYYAGTITLGAATKTGYTFDGWYRSADLSGDAVTTIGGGQTGDVELWAKWTGNRYAISFVGNGKTGGEMDDELFTYDEAKALTACAYTRTGYHFAGWNTESDGSGTAYADGQEVLNLTAEPDATLTLYAQWTANTYSVHFEPVIPVNGTMADQTFTYDQEATALTKNAFSTTTGQWLRWNTQADGSGTNYEDEAVVQNLTAEDGGTVTLYAQWHLQHRYNYDNTIFRCYNVGTPNEVYWAYAGETVKVEVIDGTSEYTIRVVNGDGEDITLDTETNTFVMPDEEVWITYTSVKKMAYTTICLDDFESWEDVAYLYDASQPTVTPIVVVKDGETVLTEGTDYTLAITNNTGSATQMVTATVTVTGMGGYVGTNTREFRITPFNIANCEIKGTLEAYDNGYGPYYPLSNNVEVWNGNTQLTLDTDYTIELDPNIGTYDYVVGEQYQAIIKGTGDWGGTKTFTFTFVALHHTIVFDANGGTGTMDGSTVANDGGNAGRYYLPECTFTAPNGKKFDHWEASCEPDVEKQPGDYFTAPYIFNVSDVQTITVTAYWRDKATFTVTLPEEMEVVSGTLTDGKAIEDEVITFRPRPGFTATDVQANGTALTPDGEGIYTLTVTADVTVTVAALRSDGLQHEVSYMTADGTTQTAQAIALDGHETRTSEYGNQYVDLAAGWYYVGTDIDYTGIKLRPQGNITLILADGCTMHIGTAENRTGVTGIERGICDLTIYGQSLDAATAGTISYEGTGGNGFYVRNYTQQSGNVSISNSTYTGGIGLNAGSVTLNGGKLSVATNSKNAIAIEASDGDITINGGQLDATATGSGNIYGLCANGTNRNITLGWTNLADRIFASSYRASGTVKVADGKALTDGSGHIYRGTLSADQISAIAGQELAPVLMGDVNGDGTLTIADVTALVNMVLGKSEFSEVADVNGDGHPSIADVTTLVNIVLGKATPSQPSRIVTNVGRILDASGAAQ